MSHPGRYADLVPLAPHLIHYEVARLVRQRDEQDHEYRMASLFGVNSVRKLRAQPLNYSRALLVVVILQSALIAALMAALLLALVLR